MNPILVAGVAIGVLCGSWTFVMGSTGWYKDPDKAPLFYIVVIAIEVIGLFWGLRRTAAEGRPYRGQIVDGTLMSVVAGVIIVAASLLFTTVMHPEYAGALEEARAAALRAQGRSPAEIAAAIQDVRAASTPMAMAMSGFIGTLVTGILASAAIALGVRAKHAPGR